MVTRRTFVSAISILLALCMISGLAFAEGPGFRSKRQFDEHYVKHGAEFGKISKDDYLKFAQELRDAPKSKDVLEAVREDGVITKFQKKKGWFGAYNSDRTIRTFFIPNDGERYFWRQAKRPASGGRR
ncbi:MAG: hypothetical protein JNL98_16035 [Bryobacterales bacterium]|nr:hypothetical protein [Bryobacterales bacterium]